MAKDGYDKLKIISDIIKDNKVLILMFLTALGSGLTNLGQLIASEEEGILKVAMIDQITLMAKAYVKPKKSIKIKPVKIKPVIRYKTIVKETIIKQECNKCDTNLQNHIKELH